MDINELRQKRGEVADEIKKLRDAIHEGDKPREFTPEEHEKWDSINAEFDELTEQIDTEQRRIDIDDRAALIREMTSGSAPPRVTFPAGTGGRDETHQDRASLESDRNMALNAWLRAQWDVDPNPVHLEACERMGLNPYHQRSLGITIPNRAPRTLAEARAMDIGLGGGTSGAQWIPEGFVRQLELSLLAFGGMRQTSSVIRTATGNDLPWPTVNDTANAGQLLNDNAADAVTPDPTVGAITFKAYKYSSNIVKVSIELLQDTGFDLQGTLAQMLGERIGRITNTHFTTGDNTAKPQGITVAASTGVTTASGTAIAADELFDLVHSVDPAYRSQPGAGFLMNDSTLKALRKLKDSQNQYLWNPGLTAGQPSTLLSYPVTVNQDMASIAVNNKTIAFGALRKYYIRDVMNITFRRLDERYADEHSVGFVAISRHDGRMLDAGTDPVKLMVQAAV